MKLFGMHLVSDEDMKKFNYNTKTIEIINKQKSKLQSKLDKSISTQITFDECWACGKKKALIPITEHHGIPQHMKPKKNVVIPVCRKCHDKIHFDDIRGMYSYIFKIEKTLKESGRNIKILKKMLDENNKLKGQEQTITK